LVRSSLDLGFVVAHGGIPARDLVLACVIFVACTDWAQSPLIVLGWHLHRPDFLFPALLAVDFPC
jgi:hypothetical protein